MSVLEGALLLRPPYGVDDCFSENEIVLARVQRILAPPAAAAAAASVPASEGAGDERAAMRELGLPTDFARPRPKVARQAPEAPRVAARTKFFFKSVALHAEAERASAREAEDAPAPAAPGADEDSAASAAAAAAAAEPVLVEPQPAGAALSVPEEVREYYEQYEVRACRSAPML